MLFRSSNLALEIRSLDQERNLGVFTLGLAPALEGRGRAHCGVKGQILGPALHRPGADVAAALARRQRIAALARRTAGQPVKPGVQPFGLEVGADLDGTRSLGAFARRMRLRGAIVEGDAANRGVGLLS